ncbi:MAG: response regulator transcription factor [Defluviitaleaceae bacterium]|nr:response regulator transcription factor [Defluviitaleaceae bacterium]
MHILILEDDPIIASGLIYALEQEGYGVTHAKTISEAETAIAREGFSLAILDMQLPDGKGFDLAGKLASTPIIYLTVVDDETSVVRAFDSGAHDYVTKPFRVRELLARVKRTLGVNSQGICVGDVSIDSVAGKVFKGGEVLELTALEYRLLLILATHRGQLLTRTQILENIWDSAGSFVEDNTLTVYIKRLREKLGDALKIETVRGVGYRVD